MDLTRRQRRFITRWMSEYRKRHQEERSEVIKHLGEEVPPQSRIWGQIREGKSIEKWTSVYRTIKRGDVKNPLDKPRLPHPLKPSGNQCRYYAKHYKMGKEFKANGSPLLEVDGDLPWLG